MSDETEEDLGERQGPPVVRAIPSTGRFFTFGTNVNEIRDNGKPVLFVDTVFESTQQHGVIYLGLGAQYFEGDNPGAVEVAARLRMSVITAQILRDFLDVSIKKSLDALKPPDKTTAN